LAFNGSGIHNRVHAWTQDLAGTIPVTASRMDAEHDDISSALSNTICRDGQSTTTARIPFASGVSAAAGTTASVSYAQSNDPNTGMYFPATDQWGLVAGGAAVLAGTPLGVAVAGTLGVSGPVTLSDALALTGGLAINTNKFNVTAASGNTAIAGTFAVAGAATFSAAVTVSSGGASITGNSTIAGTFGVSSDLSVNTNKFNVTASNGNTTVAGTLGVAGATALSGALGVTGATTLSSNLSVTGASTLTGALTANNAAGVTARNTAKAFGYFTVLGTTVVFDTADAFNVASVTRNGLGLYTIAFANFLPSANYAVVGNSVSQAAAAQHTAPGGKQTTSFTLAMSTSTGASAQEAGTVSFMVM
jgi:hypothetical protein